MNEEELGAGVQVIHKGKKKKICGAHGSQRTDGVVKVQAVCQRQLEALTTQA